MTKNAVSKSWNFTEPAPSGDYESTNPSGDVVVRLLGSGFGGEPIIEFFAKWTDGEEGQSAGLDSQDVGDDFTSGNYSNGLVSNYFTLENSMGASIRQGGTDAATTNQRTGYVRVRANFDTYLISYDIGTNSAIGRTFSSESTPYTKPTSVSGLKIAWLTDGPLDDPSLADIVPMTYTGVAGFAVDGNQSANAIFMGTRYDFDAFNAVLVSQKPDPINPKTANGVTEAVLTSPTAKTLVKVVTSQPTFDPSAANAYYNHINFPAWTGNGTQDLTQHLFRYAYFAVGDNARARMELTDSAVYEDSGRRRVIPHETWVATQIDSYPVDSKQRDGVTHLHFTYVDGTRESYSLGDATITKEGSKTVWTFGG